MANHLNTLRNRVREITERPAEGELDTYDIDWKINKFVRYDMSADLKRTCEFRVDRFCDYCEYATIYKQYATSPDDQERMRDRELSYPFITSDTSVYVDGNPVYLLKRYEDLNIEKETVQTPFVGNGSQTYFSGFVLGQSLGRTEMLLTRYVTLRSSQLHVYDDGDGSLCGDVSKDEPYTCLVNYSNGFIDVNFSKPPAHGEVIYADIVREDLARPFMVLLDGKGMHFRPVPDDDYWVTIDAKFQPVELIDSDDLPEARDQLEYIAHNVAKEVPIN